MRQREREDGAESREIERAANGCASKSVSESEGASKSVSKRERARGEKSRERESSVERVCEDVL